MSYPRPSLALVLLLALPAPAVAAAEAQDLGAGRLVLVEAEGAARVRGLVALRAGSLYEEADAKGAAELLARVLAEPEAAWLGSRGGSLTAEVDVDALRLAFECAADDLGELCRRLGARLARPEWGDAEVTRAREALVRDLRAWEASAEGAAENAVDELTYGRFREYWRRPRSAEVARLGAEAVKAFHAAHLGGDRLVLGLHGASAQALAAAAREGLGSLPTVGAAQDPVRPFFSPGSTLIYVVDVPDAETTELRVFSPVCKKDASVQSSLHAWSLGMGQGERSRLWRDIVDKGFAREVEATFDTGWTRLGLFRCAVEAENEKVGKVLDLVSRSLASDELLDRAELVDLRERFRAQEAAVAADPVAVLRRAVDVELFGYPADWYEQQALEVQEVGSQAIAGALRRQLVPTALAIVAAGPAERIQKPLEYFTETRVHELHPERDEDAVRKAESMVEAMGGKAAWERFTGAEVTGTIFVQKGLEFVQREFRTIRYVDTAHTRSEHESLRGESVTVVNGEPGWRKTGLGIDGLPSRAYRLQVIQLRRWLPSVLHRIAQDDATLGITLDEEGRLVFTDPVGEIMRVALDATGRPETEFWTRDREPVSYLHKEWGRAGDYVYPKELLIPYARGETEVEIPQQIQTYTPNPPFDPELFARPPGR